MNDKDRRYKVLLVEDDKVDRMAFERFLGQNDSICTGDTAASVGEARTLLASKRYDVVVTDHSLGDGTAFDVISLVKDVPVIFATGSGNEEIAVKALKAGASDYLVKDPDGNYLKIMMLALVRVMGRKRSEREARLLSEAVRSIADAVFVTDPAGEVIFVNAAFCAAYGYDEKESLWLNAAAFMEKGSSAGAGPWKGESVHRRKDGSTFPADYGRSILPGDDGRPAFVVHVSRDMTEKKKAEAEKEKLIAELKDALAQVKSLSGLLPTCASCRKIRDAKGSWSDMESYIAAHSEANFSHGVCPDCMQKLYPDYADEVLRRSADNGETKVISSDKTA